MSRVGGSDVSRKQLRIFRNVRRRSVSVSTVHQNSTYTLCTPLASMAVSKPEYIDGYSPITFKMKSPTIELPTDKESLQKKTIPWIFKKFYALNTLLHG